ncbi:MAG: hypothetical protein LC670_00605 [Flavobacteriales bacterium]|nr:hypothetical protein [Flavobacteriales bacterium]
MTKFILILLLVAMSTISQAQEIKMSEDAKKSYVTKERTKAQVSSENEKSSAKKAAKEAPPAYVALDLIRYSGDEAFKVVFDPGAAVRKAKYMSEDIKKIERLEEITGQFTSEVDILNYVANMGWDVVSVSRSPLEAPQKGFKTRVYVRKVLQE